MRVYSKYPEAIPPMTKLNTPTKPLSDTTIKNAKPNPDKAYKIPDEKGMHVLINANGSKYFRYKYRFAGKEKVLALGVLKSVQNFPGSWGKER